MQIFQCLNVALLEKLLEVLRSCGCTKGCPSCLVDKWTNPSDTAKAACKMMLEGIVETWMDNNTPATMGDLCSLGMPD